MATATIVSYSPTMIDIRVDEKAPLAPLGYGPISGRAFVRRHGVYVGELLLWVRDGKVTGLEQAWYTDEPPVDWPSTSDAITP